MAVVAGAGMFAAVAAGASADGTMSGGVDRFGGEAYYGAPNLAATVAFVNAGGGPSHFSIKKALVSMGGAKLITAEVGKLDKQYGTKRVGQWFVTWDFAVNDALKQVGAAGIKLPAPAPLTGHALASALVTTGVTKAGPDAGAYWTGYMLDRVISHKIHDTDMMHIDAKYGPVADADYHRITNQAMYDLAQALGATSVKLASFH